MRVWSGRRRWTRLEFDFPIPLRYISKPVMKRTFINLILLLMLFVGLAGCAITDKVGDAFSSVISYFGSGKLPTQELSIKTKNDSVKLVVEVADSESERRQGLMNREKLEDGKGMWFVFQDEAPRRFWMKNTLIPLDIIFFNGKKEAVKIVEGMAPCKVATCPTYSSDVPAMFALELPAGYVSKRGIVVGDKVE